MSNVVEFVPREQETLHVTGPAFCVHCRHEWEAVAPVGTLELECPSCGCVKGTFRNFVGTYKDESVWTCNCGNDLFKVTESGHLCVNCGVWQRFG